MKRAILTFLGIALIGYVGSYVAVRMSPVLECCGLTQLWIFAALVAKNWGSEDPGALQRLTTDPPGG